MIEFLKTLDLHKPRILDLGGHCGQFAQLAREVWRDCYIASIEASEQALPHLAQHVDEIRHVVLWDEDEETVPFYCRRIDAYGGSSGNSCFRETTGFFDDDEIAAGNVWIEQRTTTTLDSLYADKPPFDVVKLDLQGAELRAIHGGRKTVAKADVVICEQQQVEYNAGAPYAHEVDEGIRALGFRLAWESAHDVVGQKQLDRIYVREGSWPDLKLRGLGRKRPARGIEWSLMGEF